MGTAEEKGSISQGSLQLLGFGKECRVVGVLSGTVEDGRGRGRGSTDGTRTQVLVWAALLEV